MKGKKSILVYRFFAILALSSITLTIGCGGGVTYIPIGGTITLDGTPVVEAEVAFIPDSTKGTIGENSSGFTDAQGRFSLRTNQSGKEGVAPGIYRVTITDTRGVSDLTSIPTLGPGNGVGELSKPTASKSPRVPVNYSDPKLTPLRDVEVTVGKQTVDFHLKSSNR
jgi:hypothetical protein